MKQYLRIVRSSQISLKSITLLKKHEKLTIIYRTNKKITRKVKLHIGPKHKEEPEDTSSVLKSGLRQIIASGVILVVLFLLMNSSAYYQIGKSKINDLLGNEKDSPLEVLIDPVEKAPTIILSSEDIEHQRELIPKLDIEIAPLTDRIVIPRIDQNVPVIKVGSEHLINRDWQALENEIQDALQSGVVHYPGTNVPGEDGNIVLTGHSSYFPWDPGRFKDVFALLHDVEVGDSVLVYSNQEKHVYKVNSKFEVKANNIDVLKQTPDEQLTLITCTPVGTNLRRLIVTAEPVDMKITAKDSKVLR